MVSDTKSKWYNRTIGYLLLWSIVFLTFIPGIGIKIHAFGFIWTEYRLIMAVSFVMVTILAGKVTFIKGRLLSKWIIFLCIWLVYGACLLIIGKYVDRHKGIIELLAIFNSLISCYAVSFLMSSNARKNAIIKLLYWLLNIMLIWGMIEIITGNHLSSSAFNDINSSAYEYENRHMATGFLYNANDFSALITCLFPVLLSKKIGRKGIVSLLLIMTINILNNATTCNFAIIFFALYYYLILYTNKNKNAVLFKILYWALLIVVATIIIIIIPRIQSSSGILGATVNQVNNLRNSTGSLYYRLVMYSDSIKAWYNDGILGLGPSSFAEYFTVHPSLSHLVNPHAFIFELLVQYGIIITISFVFLFYKTFQRAKTIYYQAKDMTRQRDALMMIAFCFAFVFVSFAPSTFIGYTYPWLLFAIVCSHMEEKDQWEELLYA